MAVDSRAEVTRLLGEGKTQGQVRLELEAKGFSSDDITSALSEQQDNRTVEERKNSNFLSVREFFDRIGYGAAAPQFVNILFWLSQQAHPFILPLIGLLNGLKTFLSVIWSGVLQEYAKVHRTRKNTIAAAGIIFGFSFLFMSFGLLLHNTIGMILFSVSFLMGTIGVVAYGDLYQRFVHDTLRRERRGVVLRRIATWGILITAITMLISGFLLDAFPMSGVPWNLTLFGHLFHLQVYGYLLAFEITACSFIIAGYVSSLIIDKRDETKYAFTQFLGEHYRIMRSRLTIFSDKYVALLLTATIISGFLQIIITAYSGIALYQYLALHYMHPFLTLAAIYAVAILVSVAGPFFTEKIYHSTGLTPMLVFSSLIMAILPLVLVYNLNIATAAAALCLYVIGGAIMGFAQGLLAQRLMNDETRRGYFQAQSFVIILPYIILIPALAVAAYYLPMSTLFLIAAGGMILLVMPIYFILVTISQKVKL